LVLQGFNPYFDRLFLAHPTLPFITFEGIGQPVSPNMERILIELMIQ
jgi:hypothetical protein